jgi:1A family penicillin-binding protein
MWKEHLKHRRRQRYSYSDSGSTRAATIARIAKIGFVAVASLFLIALISVPILALTLPSPDKIVRHEGFSTKILDRNGKVLYDIFENERRTPVEYETIPVYLRQGVIAVEDKNFYEHPGFDPIGYLRAFYNTIFRGRVQGASTLTQQLVKNVLISPAERTARSPIRKIKELVLTIQIESRFSKDDILTMYLNEVPYGGTAVGVEAAAETYFGKNVQDLNLVESAILAGLPQRPSAYSPYSSTPKAYIPRTEGVLRRMREDGYITSEQEQEAVAQLETIEFQKAGASFKAPHFVQYVQKVLEERYGENVVEQGGLKVTTTLDLDLQDKAQEIVSEEIAKVEGNYHITNGAAVIVDPQTGEILAMVGSKNFNDENYDGQVNVTTSLRQPGSAIKPFTYAAGLKKGYTASTLLMDVQTKFPGGAGQPDYEPVNYDGKFRGPVQLRYALGNSLNIPAVKMLAMVGVRDMLQTAHDFGITTLEPTKETLSRVGLAVTLGGGEVRLLELTSGYSPFMNSGMKVDPVSVLKVEDINGKTLEQNEPKKGQAVLSPEQAYIMADILSDNNARRDTFGVNSLLHFPNQKVAVKTGTTNDRRDNWAVGGNPGAVVGVWVGNNDNSPMKSVASGVSGASPIWRRIVVEAMKGRSSDFAKPSGLLQKEVDTFSGLAAHDGFPARLEYFAPGTEPEVDTIHTKLKVCKGDGKLATPSDVAGNNYDEKEYYVIKEEDPTAGAGGHNRWQEANLAWIATQSDPRYHPPTEYCGTANPLNVEFLSPRDRDSNLPNKFTIKMSAESTVDIAILELEVDGTKVRSFSSRPYEYEVDLPNGVHKLRAKAIDSQGKQSDREITIGVKTNWDDDDLLPI